MKSTAVSIDQYLAELPEERIAAMSKLVKTIRENIPAGFAEVIGYGMPGWVVPHSLYPKGYHCDTKLPLPFLSLASQKNYISLYHMGLYEGKLLDWFKAKWEKEVPSKLDMGKCCLRFKKAENIPFKLIGELVAKMKPQDWINAYEQAFINKS